MILSPSISAPRRHRPPPLWFVTNGELTVGPVKTDLLQRGVLHGRIPDDCLVRELTWRTWRHLGEIREVRAVHRQLGTNGRVSAADPRRSHGALVERFSLARDAAEVLSLALHECFDATSASFGLIHRAFNQDRRAITTCVRGIGMAGRLGAPLEDDPAVRLARVGGLVVAPPTAGAAERCIAARLGAPADLGGVAMIPISIGNDLMAIIELGRVGHGFRSSDVLALETISSAAALVVYGF